VGFSGSKGLALLPLLLLSSPGGAAAAALPIAAISKSSKQRHGWPGVGRTPRIEEDTKTKALRLVF